MGKYFHKNKPKGNILIRVAAVLFCLTLFSIYLVTGLYARYTTSNQSSHNARVAKFSIEGSGMFSQPIVEDFIPGKSVEKELTIENNSEVAVEYTIEVTNETKNLPLQLSMKKVGGASGDQDISIPFKETKLPGSNSDTYKLLIEWKTENKNLDLMGMVDYIAVTVTATQID